ncbi:hypothetical protein N7517_000293 [Penicillium concentricum]|uniref:Carrier domain-containing protein n=1 Tax=Penicillium concentricum TaxID=293559 RepID=A0A9W9SQ14_9EURO|nr:uncharacterized protein N7517_000293 [Penicillium concentricum]KAJ5382382.1 hypothetical protein N7517_000293 [Penicillium concentricum]
MDSLVGVEMRSWWRQAFGFDIRVLELLGMGNLDGLADVGGSTAPSSAVKDLSVVYQLNLTMSTPRKTILVTGATGKQGGALIQILLSAPDTAGFNIVAVTRDITTPAR